MEIRDKMLPVLRPYGGKEEVEALREVIESCMVIVTGKHCYH